MDVHETSSEDSQYPDCTLNRGFTAYATEVPHIWLYHSV